MSAVFGWGLSGHAFEGVAEDLDEEDLGEVVAHDGSGGFGVRELLAEKLKEWAESSSGPAGGRDPDRGG